MQQRSMKWMISPCVLLVVVVTLLRFAGQPNWCACGDRTPWSWNIWSSHNSQHLIDPYFFTHVLHGIVFFGLLHWLGSRFQSTTRFQLAFLIESVWEVFENTPMVIEHYRATTISLDYSGDSIANSIFDLIACAIGYLLAQWLGLKWSILFFVATEFILLVTVRDSLILNVLMLIWPVDAIKEWQMAH